MPLRTEFLIIASTVGMMLVVWLPVWLWLRHRHPELVQTTSPGISPFDPRWLPSSWAALAVMLACMIAESAAGDRTLSQSARVIAEFVPVPPLLWFLWAWRSEVRRGDELDRRIHLDALSMAFPAFMILLAGQSLMSRYGWPSPHPDHFWALIPMLYWCGTWMMKFHYATRGFGGVPPVTGGER